MAFTAAIYQRSAPAIDKGELLSGAEAVIYLHVKQTLTSGWMNSTLKSIDCIDWISTDYKEKLNTFCTHRTIHEHIYI